MQNHTEQLSTLETLLTEQLESYRMVAGKLHEKKDSLVKGDYASLPNLDQELVILGQKTAQLEQLRMELMMQMGHPDKTLTQLIEGLSQTEANRLKPLRDNLKQVLSQIQYENEHTQSLLDLSIQWIAKTVEVIAEALTPEGASYNRKGSRFKSSTDNANPINTHSTIIHDA